MTRTAITFHGQTLVVLHEEKVIHDVLRDEQSVARVLSIFQRSAIAMLTECTVKKIAAMQSQKDFKWAR